MNRYTFGVESQNISFRDTSVVFKLHLHGARDRKGMFTPDWIAQMVLRPCNTSSRIKFASVSHRKDIMVGCTYCCRLSSFTSFYAGKTHLALIFSVQKDRIRTRFSYVRNSRMSRLTEDEHPFSSLGSFIIHS